MFTRFLRVLAIATLALVACVALSCGSSSSKNPSSTQVQEISQELFTALGSALNAGLTPPGSAQPSHPSLATALQHDPRLVQSDCTVTDTGETCNVVLTYQGNCPMGGTIAVAGDLAFTLDNSGNGSDSSALTVTPAACAVQDITFSGNPSVTVSTAFGMASYAVSYPVTFSEKGGITYGPNPSGSCTINVNATVNSATSCSVTGTICGQSVTGNC
jgi:hypothetical protein